MHKRCEHCGRVVIPAEQALGWPVLDMDGRAVCPSCYGEEAFCEMCGGTLPPLSGGDPCERCRTDALRCDRCGRLPTPEERELGWPIVMEDGLVCPSCYGDEAFCVCGQVLPATVDSTLCPQCKEGETS